MSWWEIEKELLLGDGPLDHAEEVLRAVSQEYQQEQGRKPTLEEILASLTAILRSQPDEFVAGMKGVVTEIVAKTKKEAKKQLRPGDVFCVPLGDAEYALGRLTPQLFLIDFFELKCSRPILGSKLKSARSFRFPALVMLDPLKDGRWRVIGNVPYGEFQLQPFRSRGRLNAAKRS